MSDELSNLISAEQLTTTERALAAIHEIVRAVLVPRDLLSLYRAIFRSLEAVMIVDAGYIERYSQSRDTIIPLYSVDEGVELFPKPWDYRTSVTMSWVIKHRQPLVFADLATELQQRFPQAKTRRFGDEEKRSHAWMTVPLLIKDELVGIINVQSYQVGVYGPFEQQVMQILANPLAVALENARLLDSLETAVSGLDIPLIPLTSDILVIPLVGVLDQTRWEMLTEAALLEIGSQGSERVLLDASGITSFDPQTVQALTRLIHAIDLVGSSSVLIGMRPSLIEGLVRAGVDFASIRTERNLASGLALLRSVRR